MPSIPPSWTTGPSSVSERATAWSPWRARTSVSERRSVAAVGNVFTHPAHRGRGLATRVTAAVVRTLLERRLRTVVLNVAMHNAPALRCYEQLGFWPFCGYDEGVGQLGPASNSPQE